MTSKIIQRKISSGQIILYRRVSTKPQAPTGYTDQLGIIRSLYPDFSFGQSTIYSVKEVMSGLVDAEIRMASGLGKVIRHLKRHPNAIVLVSEANRIARRPDIYELIKSQGLGHRFYDASTGRFLNDIIKDGSHIEIEQKTYAQKKSSLKGLHRYIKNGGEIGNDRIADQSKKGSETKRRLTRERDAHLLKIVSQMTFRNRGQPVSYSEICDELDRREVRTGQGRFFTPERLAHHRKNNRSKWIGPCDSYHRPRRDIRRAIILALVEPRKRRDRQLFMQRLLKATTYKPIWASLVLRNWMEVARWCHWQLPLMTTGWYNGKSLVPP
jgi:hypothetical protein